MKKKYIREINNQAMAIIDYEKTVDTRFCKDCKHFLGEGKCRAFDKIPFEVYFNAPRGHAKPLPGQTGDYVFDSDVPLSIMRVYVEG